MDFGNSEPPAYGLGLTNISAYEGFQINNRVLGLSVGYKFGGK